jgi:hypothetical protein
LEARVTDLNDNGPQRPGLLTDVSRGGVCVLLTDQFQPGDLVRVDFREGSLLGQVIHTAMESAGFRTGIEVFDVLLGNSDLARLIEQTLAAPCPAEVEGARPVV